MTGKETRAMLVRLPDDLYELLRRFAFDQRATRADVIREALRRYLSSEKPE